MPNEFARELRRNLTDTERLLWARLRGRRFGHCKFRRQAPIGPFIADFVCLEHRLIVELDGGHHAAQHDADQARTAWLESEGYRVIRFHNYQVRENIQFVLDAIARTLLGSSKPG